MMSATWLQFTGPQPRRKRAELACLVCHGKKVKCDLQARGGQGYSNCTNCATAGRDCRSRPSKRGAAKQARGAQRQPVTPPESGSNSSRDINPPQLRNSIVNEPAQIHAPLNDTNVDSDAFSNNAFHPVEVDYPQSASAHAHVSPIHRRLSVPHSSPATQATQTSEARPEPRDGYPVDTGFSHVYGPEIQSDARDQELRNAERPLDIMALPGPDLQQSFSETYFEYCYQWCPVLDRERLGPEMAQSPLLVNALALVGSHINPPMIPHDGPAAFYERARNKFYSDEESDVMTALKAISLFYWWSPRPPSILHRHSSWWWTSVVIRHCQQLGIHREPAPDHPLRHSIDLSLRKRIWWTAFARERLTAICQSKPCVIDPDDCNISLPTLDDFPDKDVHGSSKAEVFIYWVRLCDIIGRVAKYLRQSFGSSDCPFPANLGRELIHWVQSLPPHLQLPIHADRTTTFNRDVHQLHLPYLAVIIVLHLKRSSQPLPQAYPPAILAASCVARIMRDSLARGGTRFFMAITGWYCATAFIALLQACRIDALTQTANEDLDILELAGKDLGTMWPTATVFYQGFRRLRASGTDVDGTAANINPNAAPASQRPLESTEIGTGGMNIVNGIDWVEYFPFATVQTSGVAERLLAPHTEKMFLDDAFPEVMLHFEDLFEQYHNSREMDLFM